MVSSVPAAKAPKEAGEEARVKYMVDGNRAGELLARYAQRWRYELRDQVEGTVLDFNLRLAVTELCLRLAADPDLDLRTFGLPVRAMLSAHINVFLAQTMEQPEAEIFARKAPLEDRQVLAKVFEQFLPRVRLPKEWRGQPFTN